MQFYEIYEKCKKVITWILNGVTAALIIAVILSIDGASTIFWDVLIPVDIMFLSFTMIFEKVVKKRK